MIKIKVCQSSYFIKINVTRQSNYCRALILLLLSDYVTKDLNTLIIVPEY